MRSPRIAVPRIHTGIKRRNSSKARQTDAPFHLLSCVPDFKNEVSMYYRRQTSETASLGMRQSPRGESDTFPIRGPSGMQERLNC